MPKSIALVIVQLVLNRETIVFDSARSAISKTEIDMSK